MKQREFKVYICNDTQWGTQIAIMNIRVADSPQLILFSVICSVLLDQYHIQEMKAHNVIVFLMSLTLLKGLSLSIYISHQSLSQHFLYIFYSA